MDNFSNLMMIGECLLDAKRTYLFKKAINEIIKPEHTVLDAGTGSGVQALFAAKAGAKKVYGVEIDPGIAKIAKQNVKDNNLSSKVEIINDDLKKVKLPKIDVLIMEMMDTGLIAEQQIPAINHLFKAGIVDEKTIFVPSRFETHLQFVNYNFDFYGLKMPIIVQARNFGVMNRIKSILSDKILIDFKELNKINDLDVHTEASFKPLKAGDANAILLTSKIKLSKNVETWGTSDMNMPLIIPIENRTLLQNKKYMFNIKYKLAYGYNTIQFSWK